MKKKRNIQTHTESDSLKSEIQTVFPKAKIKSIYAVNTDDSFRLSVLYGYGLPGCIIFIHFILLHTLSINIFEMENLRLFYSFEKVLLSISEENFFMYFRISIICPSFNVNSVQNVYFHISRCSTVVKEKSFFLQIYANNNNMLMLKVEYLELLLDNKKKIRRYNKTIPESFKVINQI